MPAKLILTLEAESGENFSNLQASAFQGLLMEQIAGDYAAELHQQGLNPYSQYIHHSKEWVISTLTDEAYDKIIMPLMKPAFETFHLNKMNTDVRITAKILSSVSFKDMTHQYYFNDQNRMVKIKFMTPTAFKSEGAYVFVPTLKLILRSLMHKYSDATNQVADVDEDMLQTLLEHTQVIGYNFRSTMHHLENVKIPAFIGEATIKVGGPQGIVNYLNLLFRFGSFSGVGIKCSIGMGAVDIVEKDNKIDSAV